MAAQMGAWAWTRWRCRCGLGWTRADVGWGWTDSFTVQMCVGGEGGFQLRVFTTPSSSKMVSVPIDRSIARANGESAGSSNEARLQSIGAF